MLIAKSQHRNTKEEAESFTKSFSVLHKTIARFAYKQIGTIKEIYVLYIEYIYKSCYKIDIRSKQGISIKVKYVCGFAQFNYSKLWENWIDLLIDIFHIGIG